MFKKLDGFEFPTERFGDCWFEVAKYTDNSRTALQIINEEGPVGVLTVNLSDEPLLENELFIKTWGGNEMILQDVIATGLFVDTGKSASTGFVKAPIWSLK